MSILFILLIIKNSFFRHVQRTKINAKQVLNWVAEGSVRVNSVRSIVPQHRKGDIRENLDLRNHGTRIAGRESLRDSQRRISRRRRPFSLFRHNRKWKLWMEGTIKVFLLLYYAAWWLFDNMWHTILCVFQFLGFFSQNKMFLMFKNHQTTIKIIEALFTHGVWKKTVQNDAKKLKRKSFFPNPCIGS